jgi:hypothetical protein
MSAERANRAARETLSTDASAPSRMLAEVDRLLDELMSALSELAAEMLAVRQRVEDVQRIRAALIREVATAAVARDEAADERDAAAL